MNLKLTAFIGTVAFFLISCSPKEKKENATIPAADETIAILQHPVANFDTWKPYFDRDDSARKSYGITAIGIGRGIDDPNQVVMFFRIKDTATAMACMNRPELKDTMQAAGVTAPPTLDIVHTLRNDTTRTDLTDRILVKHKVKDFAAWLKVFDDEGIDKRKTFGIVDRALGRGVADSNVVYIVFAVSDWNKANAHMQSDDLKKLMADAGVEGAPTVAKYTFKTQ